MLCNRPLRELMIRTQQKQIGYCCKMNMPENDVQRHDEVYNILTTTSDELYAKNNIPECATCFESENIETTWRRLSPHVHNSINKKMVEISLDNTCNAACIYCSSSSSSMWMNEQRTANDYYFSHVDGLIRDLSLDKISHYRQYEILIRQIDVFVEQLAINDCSTSTIKFKIYGGEPFLSGFIKNNIIGDVIDYYFLKTSEINCYSRCELFLITNANLPLDILNSGLKILKSNVDKYLPEADLENPNPDHRIDICIEISNESHDKYSDFIRYGVNWNLFCDNVQKFISSDWIDVVNFLITSNCLAIPHMKTYISKIHDMMNKRTSATSYSKINFIINTIYDPEYLALGMLDDSYTTYIDDMYDYIENNQLSVIGLTRHSLKSLLNKPQVQARAYQLMVSFQYYKEHRNMDYSLIDPEMYDYIKQLAMRTITPSKMSEESYIKIMEFINE